MEAVLIGVIGKCPQCHDFVQLPDPGELHIERMPWCCGLITTPEFQGMVRSNGTWQKVRWLNKDGWWTKVKPIKPFILLGMYRDWLVLIDDYSKPIPDVRKSKPLVSRPRPRLVTFCGKRVLGA